MQEHMEKDGPRQMRRNLSLNASLDDDGRGMSRVAVFPLMVTKDWWRSFHNAVLFLAFSSRRGRVDRRCSLHRYVALDMESVRAEGSMGSTKFVERSSRPHSSLFVPLTSGRTKISFSRRMSRRQVFVCPWCCSYHAIHRRYSKRQLTWKKETSRSSTFAQRGEGQRNSIVLGRSWLD